MAQVHLAVHVGGNRRGAIQTLRRAARSMFTCCSVKSGRCIADQAASAKR